MPCPFCQETQDTARTILQTKHSTVIYNLKPLFPGHVLIIPKVHKSRLTQLTKTQAADLMHTIQKTIPLIQQAYNKKAVSITCQDGIEAGQSVEHLHFHLVPMDKSRRTRDVIQNIQTSEFRKPLSIKQIKKQVDRIKKKLE